MVYPKTLASRRRQVIDSQTTHNGVSGRLNEQAFIDESMNTNSINRQLNQVHLESSDGDYLMNSISE